MIKRKHFSTFLVSAAVGVAIFATPAMAGKKEVKALKKASAICESAKAENIEGCALTFSRRHGNCLGCHSIPGGTQPGNVGPGLVAMKARFPDRAVLRAQIWDATVKNPNSMMPPFGKHNVLSEDQIDKITDFVHSL